MKRPNLIIDVGMHDGQDTAFYLAKGFDVVAIEANPSLVDTARDRFASEIESGRLQILPVAIAETAGKLALAISDEVSVWSSMSPVFIERNESAAGVAYRYVDVPTRTFESILEEVGVPHYLKVDIEGLDMLCIRALKQLENVPDFVSIESNVSSPPGSLELVFDELSALWELGYRRFAYVDQTKHPARKPPKPPMEGRFADVAFTENCSGLFGEELPVRWDTIDKTLRRAQILRYQYNAAGYGGRWTRTVPSRAYRMVLRLAGRRFGWYDLHARLD
jgi:FkbM family methyltransferase